LYALITYLCIFNDQYAPSTCETFFFNNTCMVVFFQLTTAADLDKQNMLLFGLEGNILYTKIKFYIKIIISSQISQ